MYTILMTITLHLAKPFEVHYARDGTMEDCISTIKSNIKNDLLYERNTATVHYYYFCIPQLGSKGTDT